MNEISFNGSLLKELRAIDLVDRLIREGKLSADDYRQVRVHVIENQAELKPLGVSSKMNTEWAFLTKLRDLGRDTASRWLDETVASVGANERPGGTAQEELPPREKAVYPSYTARKKRH